VTSPFAYIDPADLDRHPDKPMPVLVIDRYTDEDGIEVAHLRDSNGTFYSVPSGLLYEVKETPR